MRRVRREPAIRCAIIARGAAVINVSDIPLLYLVISLFCSVFLLTTLLYLGYIRIMFKIRALTSALILCASAFVYSAADSLALLFSIITLSYSASPSLFLLREFAVLVFTAAMLALVDRVVNMSSGLKTVQRIFFVLVALLALAFAVLAFARPQLLTGDMRVVLPPVPDAYFFRNALAVRQLTPLFMLKGLVTLSAVLYAVIMLFYSMLRNLNRHPFHKLLFACGVLLYFIFTAIFSYFFLNPGFAYVNFYYPHLALGASLFIFLSTIELVDFSYSGNAELNALKERFRNSLYVDTRLKLQNRAGFSDDLTAWFHRNAMAGNSGDCYLLFIDIDDFGHINESFGEKVGDVIIADFASRIREHFQTVGELYRIGGDDFCFWIKQNYSAAQVESLAGRMLSSLRNPFIIKTVSYMISASIGIIHAPVDGDDTEMIFSNAYRVLNTAKKTKNCYRFFDREMMLSVTNRIQLVQLLRKNIAADRFELYYQPVVDSEENIVYVESLLRSTDKDPSIGGPGSFIPILERAGLMREVDDMVIRKAFRDMENHIADICNISINLSSMQLLNPSYCNFVAAFAAQHRISPDQVILEVVEDILIDNFQMGRENLQRLKQKGFKIAIDDFGKGFSSLSYLAELPVDIIKMDRAFVCRVPGEKKHESIAEAIVNLGHSLGLKVVAEGFETAEQIAFYRTLGCDNYQGYYFARPMPLRDFLDRYAGR